MTFSLPVSLVEYIYNAGFDDGALLGQISRGPSSPAIPPTSGATAPWASITLPEEPAFAAASLSNFGSPPSHEVSFSSPGWRSPTEATDTSCERWDAAAVGGESPIDASPEIGVEPASLGSEEVQHHGSEADLWTSRPSGYEASSNPGEPRDGSSQINGPYGKVQPAIKHCRPEFLVTGGYPEPRPDAAPAGRAATGRQGVPSLRSDPTEPDHHPFKRSFEAVATTDLFPPHLANPASKKQKIKRIFSSYVISQR